MSYDLRPADSGGAPATPALDLRQWPEDLLRLAQGPNPGLAQALLEALAQAAPDQGNLPAPLPAILSLSGDGLARLLLLGLLADEMDAQLRISLRSGVIPGTKEGKALWNRRPWASPFWAFSCALVAKPKSTGS